MALLRGRPDDIPKDAVILSPDEAFKYQCNIISSWPKWRDVWSLKYASGIMGICTTLSSVYINQHYRSRLKLVSYGRFTSYLPIVVIPAMFSMLSHKLVIQRPLVLDPLGECPLCSQLRAAIFQTGFGVAYPLLLSPIASFMFATRHYTYRVPSVTENPRELIKLWLKFTRPVGPIFGAIACGQALIAMFLTYKTAEQSVRVHLKMQNTMENEKSTGSEHSL